MRRTALFAVLGVLALTGCGQHKTETLMDALAGHWVFHGKTQDTHHYYFKLRGRLTGLAVVEEGVYRHDFSFEIVEESEVFSDSVGALAPTHKSSRRPIRVRVAV